MLPGMRMKRTVIDGIEFINDAYNANPASMAASFAYLKEFADPEKLVLLLGEMRELGAAAPEAHAGVKELVGELFPGVRLLLVGHAWGDGALADAERAKEELAKLLRPGDLLFAKGSRGVALEKALPAPDGAI